MPAFPNFSDPGLETKHVDCVEIYLAKRLSYLSGLYNFLNDMLTASKLVQDLVLDGFSIYEVDGAFRGKEKSTDERSLVIRILFERPAEAPEFAAQAKIKKLGKDIGIIAASEEEIWICHYAQKVAVFRPMQIIK
jgi:hypothetical protein